MIRLAIVIVAVLSIASLLLGFWLYQPKNGTVERLKQPEFEKQESLHDEEEPRSTPSGVTQPASRSREDLKSFPQVEKAVSRLLKDLDRVTSADTAALAEILTLSTNEDEIEYAAAALARIGTAGSVSN